MRCSLLSEDQLRELRDALVPALANGRGDGGFVLHLFILIAIVANGHDAPPHVRRETRRPRNILTLDLTLDKLSLNTARRRLRRWGLGSLADRGSRPSASAASWRGWHRGRGRRGWGCSAGGEFLLHGPQRRNRCRWRRPPWGFLRFLRQLGLDGHEVGSGCELALEDTEEVMVTSQDPHRRLRIHIARQSHHELMVEVLLAPIREP
mmetsp:Transcript_119752/g.298727  ORF Transcript_119752/g.298727 Transcript_119752/m.298727 type:complete len:207 (+) Transcript_119752:1040-1660(+)